MLYLGQTQKIAPPEKNGEKNAGGEERFLFGLAAKSHLSPFVCARHPPPATLIYVCVLSARKDPARIFFSTKTLFSVIFAQNSRCRCGDFLISISPGEDLFVERRVVGIAVMHPNSRARAGSSRVCIASCASPAAPLFTFGAATRHPLLFSGV
jgi:hypothetical protein